MTAIDNNSENSYAVIGAGPAGLSAARNLQKFDIPFQGYELSSNVGGLWDIDAPRSTMYQTAHLISSKRMTEFAEFPMRDEVALFPRHDELRQYFRDYAEHFGLYDHYRFNSEVTRLQRQDGGWQLTAVTDGQEMTRQHKGILIANGTLSEPNMPQVPGAFSGELIHSAQYKSPDIFHGKRVLVVGCGNSAADIAVDAVHHADSVALSVRRGYHFIPKFILGKPMDTLGGKIKLPFKIKQKVDAAILKLMRGDPTSFGLPAPDHGLYEAHPVINTVLLYHIGHGDIQVKKDLAGYDGSRVKFSDGSADEFDLVLLATGYKLHYPFIDRSELNWKGAAPHLYLNCFHPQHDDVFALGLVEATGLGWEGRNKQAELVARYIKGCEAGSAAAAAFRKTKQEPFDDMRGGINYLKLDRMAYYVHKDTYLKTLNRHLQALAG